MDNSCVSCTVQYFNVKKDDQLSDFNTLTISFCFLSYIFKAYDKFSDSFIYWGGAAALTIGTAVIADEADAAQDRSHRY